jgi:hypothetical protein
MDDPNRQENTQRESDIEWQRLELERVRLKLDIERVTLEKAKERTTKLLYSLPILVSIIALALSALGEYRRSVLAVSSYNETRIELFRRMASQTTDSVELEKIYAEVFPNDSIILKRERDKAQGR